MAVQDLYKVHLKKQIEKCDLQKEHTKLQIKQTRLEIELLEYKLKVGVVAMSIHLFLTIIRTNSLGIFLSSGNKEIINTI